VNIDGGTPSLDGSEETCGTTGLGPARAARVHPVPFPGRYHKRSNGEAVNSSFKRKLGAYLRSRRWWNQRREAALRVIAYNIRLLIRFRIRNGISNGGG